MAHKKKKLSLPAKMGIALMLGVVVGLIWQAFGWEPKFFKPFGDLFIRLIRMIVIPLVISSLIAGAAGMADLRKLGRVATKTIVYYMMTTSIAVTLGLVFANIFKPGVGLTINVTKEVVVKTAENPGIVQVLLNIVPTNPVDAASSGLLLQIIFFSLFFGFALSTLGEKGKPLLRIFELIMDTMIKVTHTVMLYAPYGVFALIAYTVGMHGLDVLLPLAKVILIMYVIAVIHACVVYLPVLKYVGKYPIKRFLKEMREPLLVAFSTCSSGATLPANMEAVQRMGVSKSTASFTIPLGNTINMDGAAIYLSLAAVFVAQVYGISLDLGQQFTILLMGILASIGSIGVPAFLLVVITMVFTQVGLPMEGVALIAGIDRVIDMARTTLNVLGDATAAVAIASTEGEFSDGIPDADSLAAESV